jgi:hypothetical protein
MMSGASERYRTSGLLDILVEAKGLVVACEKAYNRTRPRSPLESGPTTGSRFHGFVVEAALMGL